MSDKECEPSVLSEKIAKMLFIADSAQKFF